MYFVEARAVAATGSPEEWAGNALRCCSPTDPAALTAVPGRRDDPVVASVRHAAERSAHRARCQRLGPFAEAPGGTVWAPDTGPTRTAPEACPPDRAAGGVVADTLLGRARTAGFTANA